MLYKNDSLGQNFSFSQLKSDHVLDHHSILTIDQDTEGRLWFGGQDKLYVYDSREIINVFEKDSIFINGEYLNKIEIDRHNNIFLGTAYSLLVYNATLRKYVVPKSKDLIKSKVNDIKLWKEKALIASSKGLYLINLDAKKEEYTIERQITDQPVQTVCFIEENTILYASKNQLFQQSLVTRHTENPITLPIQDDFITAIHIDAPKIWVGTHNSGIFLYEQNRLIRKINRENTLLSNNIRKIIKANSGLTLIGTLEGLTVIDENYNTKYFTHEINIPWSISQNSIYDIYQDYQDILWFGTYFGGINAVYPQANPIRTFTSRQTSKYILASEIIGAVAESEDNLYIGSDETGLQIISKKNGNSTNVTTSSKLVKTLALIGDKLYIGQHAGGLSVLNIHTHDIQNGVFTGKRNSGTNNINVITLDRYGNTFLGTDAGLFQWHENGKHFFFQETKGNVIHTIVDNKTNGVLIIKNGGLWYKKYEQQQFEPIKTFIEEYIQAISLDNEGNIWAITPNRIYLIKKNYAFRPQPAQLYYEDHEFDFGNILYLDNHLWICSNRGLLQYNPTTNRLYTLTIEDGLTTDFLQSSKFYVNDENNIYITSLKGINLFHPQDIQFNINKRIPSVIVSKFHVAGQDIFLQKEDEHTPVRYHIRLTHGQNYFSVSFSSSNFIKPRKNKYRYMLKGFDNHWKETQQPVASYMNLDPGTYTLYMMASNNDGVWCEKPIGIGIHIAPPFYRTWWAYTIYAGLALAVIYFIIRFIVERQLLINSEKEHEKKIRFFTQISHEIRTPLTLITAPLDEIITETANQTSVQQKVKRMKKNANKLLSVINELLDFRKLDEKKQTLKKTRVSLSSYIEDSFYLLSDLAHTKGLNYYIRRLDNAGFFPLDNIQFDKVMFNLLSNAIKYTPERGTVYLELIDTEETIEIRIVDNGIGVSEGNQFKIFEEYYRQNTTEDVIGTGIGLALTKEIVKQHSGDIMCRSMMEGGQQWTVFSLYFKKQNTSDFADDVQLILEESAPLPPLPATKYEIDTEAFILIVEDNRELLETIVDIFQGDHRVITARDGEEGLKKAREHMPDIILSDMMMPKMNGLELCQALKENVVSSHIPFILLTAVSDRDIHTRTLQYGANIYLTKPFDKRQLYLSVRNLLAISKQRRKDFKVKVSEIDNEVDKKFMDMLDQLIEEHIEDNAFGVESISRAMCMSTPVLYRKLKAITDLSLNNYVKIYRLNKAKELLSTHMNISEVAYAVGFSDRKYFSKEFKKLFGVNPSEFNNSF